ncbi:iron ABC transporter substrate-binding protein, partial [Pseudomonas sp. JV245A]|nr:iron ABC transporter substrate-binding protein [Pseudomonas sp. JV245A]
MTHRDFLRRAQRGLLLALLPLGLLWAATASAATLTDLAGRQVQVPEKVEHILLGE